MRTAAAFILYCLLLCTSALVIAAPTISGVQTSESGRNRTAFSVAYDQLGLVIGDVVVVSVTTDYAQASSLIVQSPGHPGGTTVYNADGAFGQPRLRVDVLVYDGTWPATLDYTFSTPDKESWIAYATRWTGVDTLNPVAAAAGNYDGVTSTPTSPGLVSPTDGLTAVAVYGAREDDFDSNGTPVGYTSLGIGASNIGSTGSSSGIAYLEGVLNGPVPAAVWSQAAATQAHAVHLLLQNSGGSADTTPLAVPQLTGFDTVNDEIWDETAVRKVLRTFAFGGQATDAQIAVWANRRPDLAIAEILTFDEHNSLLSPVGPQNYDRLDTRSGTLRGLGDFWASNDPNNGVDPASRWVYDIAIDSGIPSLVWLQAATSRGLNPFRQKIGLWETNYHLAVNRNAVRKSQMIRYYDDIMSALERGEPYQDVLTVAATSAAVASQYGHRLSQYANGECRRCNEDFAREYYQLFFGILGEDDPSYHEVTTIKNMSKALTDMSDVVNGAIVDYLTLGTDWHFPDPVEMLRVTFGGSNALERISQVSQYAIEQPESLNNLPVMIIGGLADDNLDVDKITLIRSAWASMPQKNLLDFLRAYAISTLFHDPGRIKYLSSIDRNILILNQITLVNEANYLGVYSAKLYEEEDVEVFYPRHNVFGGQTGREAADSADVFLANYNVVTGMSQRFRLVSTVKSGRAWQKDWAAVVPLNGNGAYVVGDVAEWLWNRFLGDGLKNFGPLERAHVYALLATELDLAYLADTQNPGRIITTAEVQTSPLAELVSDLANRTLPLNTADGAQRLAANRRVGQAINFIVGTPFIFAEEGR